MTVAKLMNHLTLDDLGIRYHEVVEALWQTLQTEHNLDPCTSLTQAKVLAASYPSTILLHLNSGHSPSAIATLILKLSPPEPPLLRKP